MSHSITGKEFKAIRELCGYSARELVEVFASQGNRAASIRAVYRIEEEAEVPWRYVEALRTLVGRQLFLRSVREIRKRQPAQPAPTGVRKAIRARGIRVRPHADDQFSVTEARFLQFLNKLPPTGNTIEWITSFRDALRELLGDVDRVTINVNLNCSLENPQEYGAGQIVTEHIQDYAAHDVDIEVSTSRGALTAADRLLEDFRRQGYPFERYQPPHGFDYLLGGHAYLGTIFLWRKRDEAPTSEKSLGIMASLEPFFLFALSDLVARARQNKPQNLAFNDALAHMIRTAGLTDQERRVVMLQLFGHSYEQIADKLCLSLDAVRKHVKSVYRKTDTHSYIELFAKYFTPRLGF